MTQYKKLFATAEIEYITPFFKLWMSFNNWYKQDLENIRTDRVAINTYKQSGALKTEFLKLLNGRSNEDEKFQDALACFVRDIDECDFENFDYPEDLFTRNPSDRVIQNNSLVFISPHSKEFYLTSGEENRLFEHTLEIIYQLRCKLIHGDFDMEDQLFIDLVEKAFLILHPVLNRVLETQEENEYFCTSASRNVEARGTFENGRMTVLAGSKLSKEAVDSDEEKKKERESLLQSKAEEEADYFLLTYNLEFNSPSAASGFCLGRSSNGWMDWKSRSGKTMDEILRNNQS